MTKYVFLKFGNMFPDYRYYTFKTQMETVAFHTGVIDKVYKFKIGNNVFKKESQIKAYTLGKRISGRCKTVVIYSPEKIIRRKLYKNGNIKGCHRNSFFTFHKG